MSHIEQTTCYTTYLRRYPPSPRSRNQPMHQQLAAAAGANDRLVSRATQEATTSTNKFTTKHYVMVIDDHDDDG